MIRHISKRVVTLAALVGAFTVGHAAVTEASFMAAICNDQACTGGNDLFVIDNGAGDLKSTIPGVILMTPGTGYHGYEVVINTSQSKPALPNGMDLSYVVTNLKGGGPPLGPIWLYAIDTDFVGPQVLNGHLGGTQDTGGSTNALICGGASNAPAFSPCTQALTTDTLVALSLTHLASANPYALAIGVQISGLGGGETATGDFRVAPEPASMALFGLGLATFAGYQRRRRSTK
jgi:PEP-CTERM motif-containing protein